MLLPDNINPNDSIYLNGAIILKELEKYGEVDMIEFYNKIMDDNSMHFSVYILSLDWLFLINLVILDNNNILRKCS